MPDHLIVDAIRATVAVLSPVCAVVRLDAARGAP